MTGHEEATSSMEVVDSGDHIEAVPRELDVAAPQTNAEEPETSNLVQDDVVIENDEVKDEDEASEQPEMKIDCCVNENEDSIRDNES